MYSIAVIIYIEAPGSEIPLVDKPKVRHKDPTFSCGLIVSRLLQPDIFRVVSVTEFYYPVPIGIREYGFRTSTSAVGAII